MIYLNLFFSFLKVGLFSFGGAYGAIPLIRDVVLANGWLDEERITYMIAVSESTPGPIMVNLATYIGSTQAGFAGALVATLGVILPSFFVILLVIALLNKVIDNEYFQATLMGLKACVVGMIFATGLHMIKVNCMLASDKVAFDYKAVIIAVILVAVLVLYKIIKKKRFSPIALIMISAAIGIVIY